MASFSWSDSFQALLSPCLSCLRVVQPRTYLTGDENDQRGPLRLRSDDLEGLLADSGSSSTDADAETLSLHSNIGNGGTRKKKARFGKSIRFFGWDLFGKPPIHLPEDEEEGQSRRQKKKGRVGRMPTLSSSTLDSDAALLDPSAIPSRVSEHVASQEEEMERIKREEAERLERRARRRERKEMKRAALALSMNTDVDSNVDFEGFQGSGPALPAYGRISSPLVRSDDGSSASGGSFVKVSQGVPTAHVQEDEDDGDFDAQAYTRRKPASGSQNGSDSRSRTSASQSHASAQDAQIAHYNHQYLSQTSTSSPVLSPRHQSQPSPLGPTPTQPKRSKKSSKSSSSKQSASSTTASQSPSLASPVASYFPDPAIGVAPSPRLPPPNEEFEGFPNDLGIGREGLGGVGAATGGFPSPHLGGPRMNGKKDMGAFLARRGDE